MVIDPTQSLVQYFDPVGDGLTDALAPGVRSVDSVTAAGDVLSAEAWAGC
ncbi:hypothetical protein [Nocardia gipuzkoensis]